MKIKAITLVIFLLLFAPLGFTITQADLIPSPVKSPSQVQISDIDVNSDGGITFPEQVGLSIVKTALPTTYDHVGQVIDYSYLVTNTGDVILAGPVTVSDNKSSDEVCPDVSTIGNSDGNFDPAESITCTATYIITQDDLDAGSVTNVASATADGTTSPTDNETVTAIQSPALTIVKNANPTTYNAVGQVISYSFLVTNTGNVNLAGPVTVSDNKALDESCPNLHSIGDKDSFLDPGESITCTASYSITQADLNSGSVTNIASASAGGTTSPTDTETVTATSNPALTLVKIAPPPKTYDHVGQVIAYSFVVTNSGNVSLVGPVTVSDDKTTNELCPNVNTVGNLDGFLDPGESITCTSSYTITQADLNSGSVTNIASATADGTTSPTDTETVTAIQNPALTIAKTADPTSYSTPGEMISYSFLVTNSGNVSLSGPVTVSDDKTTNEFCPNVNTVGNLDGFLDPGESITCTSSYTITQADLNAGSVTNIASATADGTTSPTDTETVTAIQSPALTNVKTALPKTYNFVGQVISYSYLVTNTGNVRLVGPVTVSDNKTSNESCPNVNTVGNLDGFLDPGEFITCTSSYTIIQADLNLGSVTNVASATAGGTTSPTDTETITAAQGPALAIVKTALPVTYNHVGQVISYSFLVTNTGNVSLVGPVTVSDNKTSNESCPNVNTVGNLDGFLDPGEFITCTASYTITQGDLNSGSVTNIASASAGGTTSPTDTETVTAATGPALFIVKTASPKVYDHPGQVISYSFKVENTGNVTLSGPFTVFDDKATDETCPSTPTSLDPGQFITCTASYTILLSDMSIGSVTNAAYATGKKGPSTITSNIDTETITAARIIKYTFIPLTAVSRSGVHVLAVSYQYVSHETQFIVGEVTNNTSNSITLVDVVVNFIGSGGNTVATGHAYLRPFDLPAWERGCFKISMNVPPAWSYYQLKNPTYNISGTSSGLKIIDKSGSYNSNTDDYVIVGHIRNDGSQDSLSVDVSGTVYNAYGVPVGCEHNVINPDLSPGQVSSFELNYLGYYRDYIDVSYYKLRVAGDLP